MMLPKTPPFEVIFFGGILPHKKLEHEPCNNVTSPHSPFQKELNKTWSHQELQGWLTTDHTSTSHVDRDKWLTLPESIIKST